MHEVQDFKMGDQFVIPWDREFFGDIFTITNVRVWGENFIIDGICDGDDAINISVNSNEIERI